MQLDRHIAVSGAWIAGPAFGASMMAAPAAFDFQRAVSLWVFWIGLLVFLGTLAAVLTLSILEKGRKRLSVWPLTLMTTGTLIFGTGLAWFVWPKSKTASEVNSELGKSLDYTIELKCDLYTPSDGVELKDSWYYYVYMTPRPGMDGREAISVQPIVAGSRIRADRLFSGSTVKCRLSNNGDKIVTSAQFRLTFEWYADQITDPKDIRGSYFPPTEYISPPLTLGTQGGDREAHFYIVNTSESFVHIIPSETVDVKLSGSDATLNAKLITGNGFHNRTMLWPKRFTNSPNAAHPDPVPPASPAGK